MKSESSRPRTGGPIIEEIIMVVRGHVKNGTVVLDEPTKLPEGAEVEVSVLAPPAASQVEGEDPTLYDRLKPIIGAAQGLPSDASANVDHYLYGHPKK
jgi:hypothetical protein